MEEIAQQIATMFGRMVFAQTSVAASLAVLLEAKGICTKEDFAESIWNEAREARTDDEKLVKLIADSLRGANGADGLAPRFQVIRGGLED